MKTAPAMALFFWHKIGGNSPANSRRKAALMERMLAGKLIGPSNIHQTRSLDNYRKSRFKPASLAWPFW